MTSSNVLLFRLCLLPLFFGCNSGNKVEPEPVIHVNVAVVYHNPEIHLAGEAPKRFHELFGWNDPEELNRIYKDSMESFSHGTVKYHVVKVIDEQRLWTRFADSTEYLSVERVHSLLNEPGWNELKGKNPKFAYEEFVEHHGFRELRDKGEIHEVWVWSWPYGGMYESQQLGKDAFWCNSPPIKTDGEKILTVMGFNFERTADLALHSFGHRAESVMSQVYGRWKPVKEVKDPNLWEVFTSLDKDSPLQSHVGNCHFPPNGVSDYDYSNTRVVQSYAYEWDSFPDIRQEKQAAREVSCEDWECSQMGFMSWWMSKFPHSPGVNAQDGRLNNWWHYMVNYEAAVEAVRKQ